ncbi:helix-turn-helix transcriptional regulator, partial [Listeria seeligeri]|nr:helix-turn-helix transcriptional regulator [Listeria seeligeri]
LRLMNKRGDNNLSVSDIVKATGVPKATLYKKLKELKKGTSS